MTNTVQGLWPPARLQYHNLIPAFSTLLSTILLAAALPAHIHAAPTTHDTSPHDLSSNVTYVPLLASGILNLTQTPIAATSPHAHHLSRPLTSSHHPRSFFL
ncbi:hypothetical protein DENSPDRAFT_631712 [Dentipellis sp. KUC8613]|nr:hypothetical protein DENSPDRAFT_631712 [Dentipellis sp. KUC8613]